MRRSRTVLEQELHARHRTRRARDLEAAAVVQRRTRVSARREVLQSEQRLAALARAPQPRAATLGVVGVFGAVGQSPAEVAPDKLAQLVLESDVHLTVLARPSALRVVRGKRPAHIGRPAPLPHGVGPVGPRRLRLSTRARVR